MDLQTAIICLGVCCVSAAVVYLISVLGMKEKTYEEAIAEQRRNDELLLLQKKSDKTSTSKDKKHKNKWGRKSKEKAGGEHDTELHVGFKPEMEIIPDEGAPGKEKKTATAPPTSKSSAPKKTEEIKSILIKKDKEQSPSLPKEEAAAKPKQQQQQQQQQAPPKQQQAITTKVVSGDTQQAKVSEAQVGAKSTVVAKERTPPLKKAEAKTEPKEKKPDVAADKKREAQTVAAVEKEPEKENPVKEAPLKADEKKTTKQENLHARAPSPPKKVKKPKLDDEALNSNRLATLIKTAVLSHTEIQSLIDALLNKQQSETGNTEWLKIGQKFDPVSVMRKQLQEKEEALTEERQRALASGTKLKELRQELNSDKTRLSQLERAMKERQQEVQRLHGQLQHSLAENSALQKKLQLVQTEVGEEHRNSLQKLKEENNQLHQTIAQNETKSNSLQCEINDLNNKINQLNAQQVNLQQDQDKWHVEHQQMQENIRNLELAKREDADAYNQRISESNEKVRALEAEKSAFLADLQSERTKYSSLESEREILQQHLGELENSTLSLEATKRQYKNLIEDLKQQKSGMENQITILQNQCQDANAKLVKLDELVNTLKEENELIASQLSKVTERQEAEGQEGSGHIEKTNGHIEESGDQTQIPLTDHENILHEKEKLVEQLASELKDRKVEMQDLYKQIEVSQEENKRLTVEVESQKKKNNDLREKNWKAMDALSTTEKSVNDRVKQAEKLANEKLTELQIVEQKHAQEVLERLFPEISLGKSIPYSEWLSQFENKAQSRLEEISSKANVEESEDFKEKLKLSEETCNKLRSEVQHYEITLEETERMLKKLQGSVENEELKWKEKLAAKEQELTKLLEAKKALEVSLEQVRSAQEAAVEMQDKLKELQEKLEGEENERRSLEVQRKEFENSAAELQARLTAAEEQLTAAEEQLHQWKMEKESLGERAKEVEAISKELERERQTIKALTSENVKLKSLVQIGQDELRAEQETSRSLQIKLEACRPEQVPIVTTNGPPADAHSTSDMESRYCGVEAGNWPNPSQNCSTSATYFPLSQQIPYVPTVPSPSAVPLSSSSNSGSSKKAKPKKRGVSAKN